MESKESNNSQAQTSFGLFDGKPSSGFGFFDSPEKPLPPPPPSIEVLPTSELSPSVMYKVEPVSVGGLTLLKGRVSTQEVFKLSNSDLVPGKYEGGLKLWEGSIDLITALSSELEDGSLSFTGKRVLELGCGHGLPGIFSCLKDAAAVHFQDFNEEVLRCLTVPNVNANLQENCKVETRFFAGDWGDIHSVLPFVTNDKQDKAGGYDVIIMAETVYSLPTLPSLYELIKKSVHSPDGVVYVAAKKYYFGVGGGSRRFISVVEKDGVFAASLVAEVADGSSNVREVWKLKLK